MQDGFSGWHGCTLKRDHFTHAVSSFLRGECAGMGGLHCQHGFSITPAAMAEPITAVQAYASAREVLRVWSSPTLFGGLPSAPPTPAEPMAGWVRSYCTGSAASPSSTRPPSRPEHQSRSTRDAQRLRLQELIATSFAPTDSEEDGDDINRAPFLHRVSNTRSRASRLPKQNIPAAGRRPAAAAPPAATTPPGTESSPRCGSSCTMRIFRSPSVVSTAAAGFQRHQRHI